MGAAAAGWAEAGAASWSIGEGFSGGVAFFAVEPAVGVVVELFDELDLLLAHSGRAAWRTEARAAGTWAGWLGDC